MLKKKKIWSNSEWSNYVKKLVNIEENPAFTRNHQRTIEQYSKVLFTQTYFPFISVFLNGLSVLLGFCLIATYDNDFQRYNSNGIAIYLSIQSVIKTVDLLCLMSGFSFYTNKILCLFRPCMARHLNKGIFEPYKTKCVTAYMKQRKLVGFLGASRD